MPAESLNQSGSRNDRNRSRTPVILDMDAGPSSAGTPYSLDTSDNRNQDSLDDTEYLAPTTQLEATSAVASMDSSFIGNNANWNMLFGTGGIVNNNPNMNFHPDSGAVVNYAPVNYAPINNYNNFMIPEGHVRDHADSQETIINVIMTLIADRFISDALHDTQPKHAGCMLGTRESVLAGIARWIKQDPTRIFWLAGMAGTGKTSIAVTLCRMLWDDMSLMLGESFFCSRSAGSIARTDVRNILPTLAATLATQCPEFAVALAAALKEDPRATQRPVSDQLQVLLIRPLDTLASSTCPIILLIDGLDECNDEREVAELLSVIADLKINRNVKFVVTSRPDMHIRGTPISNPDHNTILQLHTIKEEEVTIDIRRYVRGTLEASATATTAAWYTNADVETLVSLSNGLFIFASTVLLYVLAREQARGRKERLHKVIYAATHGSAATASLDKIYEMIVLEAARSDFIDADELRATQRVLATILTARTPLSVLAMADLLETDVEDVRGSLERLHSIVYMPTDDNAVGVRVLHASFGDYVVSRAADHVRLPATLGDEILARGCLRVISTRLHFNISQCHSSYAHNPYGKPDTFTLSLEYACLEWIYHVASLADASVCDHAISTIFCVRLLFWLEVMSVLDKVQRASAMLVVATATVKSSELAKFFRDAKTFVASSSEAIKRSAPNIYLSALPFAAKDSLLYQTFAPLCTGLISVEVFGVDQHGGRLIMTLKGHSGCVTSIDCSSDGRLILSGSDDGTVRIWDIRTGEETIPPLECDSSRINSVAFAPNGKFFAASTATGGVFIWSLSAAHVNLQWRHPSVVSTRSVTFSLDGSLVASGFGDGIVRLWQVETGNIFTTLICGHKEVEIVAFSPDGVKVASVSGSPGIIQLWLVATGEAVGRPLRAKQLDWNNSICFSPDGMTMAMQSQEGCVELREIDDWTVTSTIRHGTSELNRTIFSPDGQSIASASCDRRVYLSAISFEGAEAPPIVFSGHTDWATSVTFSHDGLYIISCSDDCTIRIWDTGGSFQTAQTLSTHTDSISTVATAPDGTFIVSGSRDCSVRIWDAHTGNPRLSPFLGHADAVLSVSISPNGLKIASASADMTVRIWDTRDGQAIGDPLTGHKGAVNSVAFSSDVLWLASGSDDRTVRIWDAAIDRPAASSQLDCLEAVSTIAFSPNGHFIAAGENCGRIHIWRTGIWQSFCASLQNLDKNMHYIGFTPDSTRIVSGGHRGRIAVWNISTRQKLLTLRSVSGWVNSVAVSHDGMLICSSSSVEKFVRIRNAKTGKDVLKLEGHKGEVNSLALQPDGRSLVSCSADRSIRVWDLAAARPRPSGDHFDLAQPFASTTLKDGWLVSSSGDLLLWVPMEYRKHLPIWPCTMLIAEQRVTVMMGSKGWHRGTSWTSCWLESAWNASS